MSALVYEWTRTLSRLESRSPEGVTRPVHLLTELVERDGDSILNIMLTDSKNVWEGSIESKSMLEYGSKHTISNLENYLSITHDALTGKTTHPPSDAVDSGETVGPWEFELKTDDGDLSKGSFVWKKSLSSGIKVHFGAVNMCRQEGGVSNLLDELITELQRRDDKVQSSKEGKQECIKQRAAALELVKQSVEGKENYEQEMISSFILALNKKKEKIRCLQEELKLISRIRSGVDLRDSGSETEGEGKEEQVATKANSSNVKETEKKSGLLKARLGLDKDDNDDDVTGPPLKKRTRVAMVIPKEIPKDTTTAPKQKGRAASRKSKTSLDADDLIKDM
ncbi:DNA repair protein XRCC4 isoform X2 [Oopsacas minuta]|uniref:DNA repair protein XRCC4 isoform X2 n=1 Tax=Oopsacas minuta TaxID=111878 RepID=A0AAV7KFC9_9METZ|nr:DNA repair protein XRCC4 isoform X2 [Oopsacas minuta]